MKNYDWHNILKKKIWKIIIYTLRNAFLWKRTYITLSPLLPPRPSLGWGSQDMCAPIKNGGVGSDCDRVHRTLQWAPLLIKIGFSQFRLKTFKIRKKKYSFFYIYQNCVVNSIDSKTKICIKDLEVPVFSTMRVVWTWGPSSIFTEMKLVST